MTEYPNIYSVQGGTGVLLNLCAIFTIMLSIGLPIYVMCQSPPPKNRGSAYKVAMQGQTNYKKLLNQGKIDSAEYIKLIKGETELNKMKYEKSTNKSKNRK